jgi:META domain
VPRHHWAASIVGVAVLSGCHAVRPPEPTPEPAPAPDREALANARYVGILERPVALHDGTIAVPSGAAASRDEVRLLCTIPVGDLDHNGVTEVAVVLSRSGGGSGSFVYLGVADHDNLAGIPVQLVGDRIQIRALSASADAIRADVVRAGPDDAACCPGETVELTWPYRGGALSAPHEGPPRRVDIDDFAGRWRLASFDDEPVAVDISMRIDGARFDGHAACNSYSGELQLGTHPGQLHIGPIATTMMHCPPQEASIEHAYLGALSRGQTYSFAPGRLMFGYFTTPDADGALHTLVFEHATAAP